VELDSSLDDYHKWNRVSHGFQHIIHTGFLSSEHHAELEANVLRGLLDSAKAQSVNDRVGFIFTTGALVYGSVDHETSDDVQGTENCHPYIRLRLAHEAQALAASTENLNVSVIRPVWVYGGSHVDFWASACKKAGKIVLPQNNGRLSFIHKEDLGEYYRLLAENFGRGYYAASEGAGPSIPEIVEVVKRVIGVDTVERVDEGFPLIGTYGFPMFGFNFSLAIEPKRGKTELGFVPKYNFLRDAERLLRLT
jgi:nucleoside-diphosphate-sugar epimerase